MSVLKVTFLNIQKYWRIAFLVILVMGAGYYLGRVVKINPDFFRNLQAELPKPVSEIENDSSREALNIKELSLIEKDFSATGRKENGTYFETAQEREGLTHLARRVLKRYLAENSQDFEVKAEHKIFIEDYLAKSLGGRWLEVGEEVGFSEELIREALNKAKDLTDFQLENLSQYVQLVPSL